MTKKAKVRQNDTQKPEASTDLVKKEYTDAEKVRIARYLKRFERKPVRYARTSGSVDKPNLTHITTDETLSAAGFTEAFGTPDSELQMFLLSQVVQTFRGYVSSDSFDYSRMAEFANNSVALLEGIQPRDEVEGMLAIQMIAVHNIAMETMKRAMITGQTCQGTEGNVNNATKMLRTFTAQMEALKRYRTGGQQKVIVEHVNVNQGGQAIVGAVSTGGRGYGEQKHE